MNDHFLVDAFELDSMVVKKIQGKMLKEVWLEMRRAKQQKRWEEDRKLDLVLAK